MKLHKWQKQNKMKNNNLFINNSNSTIIHKFNSLLLNTDWNEVDFDNLEFSSGINLTCNILGKDHKEFLALLFEIIPEWKEIIGRKQHQTHFYTLDIHILTVLKKIKQQSEFEKLDEYSKLTILWGGLLHDIEKIENIIDPLHPAKGAERSEVILKKLGLGDDFVNKVCTLVRYHPVVGFIAIDRLEFNILDLMNKFGNIEMAKLFVIFARADIKSVKANEAFYNENINNNIDKIYHEILDYSSRVV
jgi:UTP:GlnB (protein PII) uridylyltransferase